MILGRNPPEGSTTTGDSAARQTLFEHWSGLGVAVASFVDLPGELGARAAGDFSASVDSPQIAALSGPWFDSYCQTTPLIRGSLLDGGFVQEERSLDGVASTVSSWCLRNRPARRW